MAHLFSTPLHLVLLPLLAFSTAALALDGGLDPTFGLGGKVQLVLPAGAGGAAVATQSNGMIVVGGDIYSDLSSDFVVTRLLPNGSLDTTFGTNGIARTDFGGRRDNSVAMLVQSDDKIVLVGRSFEDSNGYDLDLAVARYLPNGALDTSFNGTGKLLLNLRDGSNDQATAIIAQPDGKLLIAANHSFGATYDANMKAAIIRLNTDGSLDTTFNGTGIAKIDFGGIVTTGEALALQKDGRIVLGARSYQAGTSEFALARLQANGTLDTSFGSGGMLTTRLSGFDTLVAVAIQNDGRIVAAGQTQPLTVTGVAGYALVRYLPSGALDPSFNSIDNSGKVISQTPGRSGAAHSITLHKDGRITLAADSYLLSGGYNADFALLRYLPTGALDTGFGVNGFTLTDFSRNMDLVSGMAVQPDGKILLVGGSYDTPFTRSDITVARYEADGPRPMEVAVYRGTSADMAANQELYNHSTVQFNSTGIGSINRQTFTIVNQGDERLPTVQVVRQGTAGSAQFTLDTSRMPYALEPGQSASFDVNYTDTTGVPAAFTVLILSNDEDENPFEIHLGANPISLTMDAVKPTYLEDNGRNGAPGRANFSTKISIPVRLSAPLKAAFAVPVVFSGSAVLGKDFNTTTTKLSFAAGQTVANIAFTLVGDLVPEFDKTLRIELGMPSTPAVRLGLRSTASILILDDDTKAFVGDVGISAFYAVGESAGLGTDVSGSAPLTLTWKKNGIAIPGANQASLAFESVTLADAGSYTLTAKNLVNTVTSKPVTVSVIDTSAKTVIAAEGGPATLSVATAGPGLTYQWQRRGLDIPGATKSTYTILKTQESDEDTEYTCNVTLQTNGGELRTTDPMSLFIGTQKPSIALSPNASLPRGQLCAPYYYGVPIAAGNYRAATEFRVKGLPAGLTINAVTGIISGKPLVTSTTPYQLTITAINALGTHTLEATLFIDPLPDGVAGIYVGQVGPAASINDELGGRLDMTITANGLVSGKFTLGAEQHPFAGAELKWDNPGLGPIDATFLLPRKGKSSLHVLMYLDSEHNCLSGLLTDTAFADAPSAPFWGWRNVWKSPKLATAYRGYHTFYWRPVEHLLPDEQTTDVPHGYSYGSLTVQEASGIVALVGKLADGTAYTGSTFISEDGYLPVYQLLYTPADRGSICGQLQLEPSDHRLSGNMTWRHGANENATARNYPQGFTLDLGAAGGLYTPPVSPKVALDIDPGTLNAHLGFIDFEAGTETQNLSIGTSSRVTFPAGVKTTLTINSITGLLSGNDPVTSPNPLNPKQMITRSSTFNGIIVNEASRHPKGYGFYLQSRLPQQPGETLSKTLIQSNALELSRSK